MCQEEKSRLNSFSLMWSDACISNSVLLSWSTSCSVVNILSQWCWLLLHMTDSVWHTMINHFVIAKFHVLVWYQHWWYISNTWKYKQACIYLLKALIVCYFLKESSKVNKSSFYVIQNANTAFLLSSAVMCYWTWKRIILVNIAPVYQASW